MAINYIQRNLYQPLKLTFFLVAINYIQQNLDLTNLHQPFK